MAEHMVVSDKCDETNMILSKLDRFGKFQMLQYFLICLPLVLVPMMNVNFVFAASDVNYRCKVPQCDSSNDTVQTPTWWPENVDSKCYKPVLALENITHSNATCYNSSFLPQVELCQEWMYENNNSLIVDLDLACEQWKVTMIGSVHNAGMIVSMLLMGWLSDQFGRKKSLIICSVSGFVGVAKPFITNFYGYLAVEFLESVLSSGIYTVAIVLMIEVGGQTKRVLTGVIFSYATYLSEVIFGFIALGIPYWKHLLWTIYSPAIIFISYTYLIHESTRWQILNGHISDAKVTYRLMSKVNNLNISDTEHNSLSDDQLRAKFSMKKDKVKETLADIVGSKEIMIRIMVTSFCFFTAGFVFYGLTVNAVLLPGNKYVNFALSSFASFPGDLLAFYCFNNFGRRISLQIGYFSCAIFCLAQALTPTELPWVRIFLYLCGKIAMALSFTGIFTYSLELFPTSVRGSLVGCGNTAARIGSTLCALSPLLTTNHSVLPATLYASSALVAGLLLTLTPETKNLPLFDTIAQIEANKIPVTQL